MKLCNDKTGLPLNRGDAVTLLGTGEVLYLSTVHQPCRVGDTGRVYVSSSKSVSTTDVICVTPSAIGASFVEEADEHEAS